MDNYSRGSQVQTNTVVFYLIVANVIFYLVSHYLPGVIPYGPGILTMHYPSSDYFRPFQVVTYMFMHANLGHIFFNMYGLFIFGTILEQVWGPRRFAEFYFLTGLGSLALYTSVQAFRVYALTGSVAPSFLMMTPEAAGIINQSMLGASGAIFGVLTAFALLFPNTELFLMFVPVPIKAKYLVGGYVLYELYSGITNNPNDNVAHFAHLGGALVGFIIIKFWNRNRNSLY